MNRSKPFLLGLYSISGQVLLLRELISSFNGDELLIGWAMFGWLSAVAVGAYAGGRVGRAVGAEAMFIGGSIMLVLLVPAVRLCPMLISDVVGQVIPFGTAAVISTLAMLPVALLSGWLFTTLAREGWATADAIVTVYLWEGIGAFVGGVLIACLAGGLMSNLALTLAVAIAVVAFVLLMRRDRRPVITWLFTVVTLLLLTGVSSLAGRLDEALDRIKYPQYEVLKSFDTHYGRQSLLSRDDLLILLSDNKTEAILPDLERAENLLIPPLLCRPGARDILYFGRCEFGIAHLARAFPQLQITAVDPRWQLTSAIDQAMQFPGGVSRLTDDPVSFIAARAGLDWYDVIIVDAGEPDSYRTSRLLGVEFFMQARRLLREDGLLVVPTGYDTDRYVSDETAMILSTIHQSLAVSFEDVVMWPGTGTVFMASASEVCRPDVDAIVSRLDSMEYQPVYLSEGFLRDRLSEFKLDRLNASLIGTDQVNSVARPVLPHLQGMYRSRSGFDRAILSLWFNQPYAVLIGLTPLLAVLAYASFGRARRRRFGLFLYSTAGLVSIALELLSFYVYQTTAGSLYAEMAALVGAFMLGLAGGTYYSRKLQSRHLEYPALIVLLIAVTIFFLSWHRIDSQVALAYHLMFLFVVALASGSLFVAATARYYEDRPLTNRGVGYAVELLGSAIGALVTLAVLLPMVGISWVLILLGAVLVVALVGALLTERCY